MVPGVAVADAVVELELPVGAGPESLPQAVNAAAARAPATSRVLREIQRLYGMGTSGRVGIVGIESAIDFADRPEPAVFGGNSSAQPRAQLGPRGMHKSPTGRRVSSRLGPQPAQLIRQVER
ncbi:hypothetical protein IFM12276_45840 [Nocardia sputorum]|uniref:Uncharacterized protein n=1 Tax=Nocardia sputorum TaxID=2984338 RepID=A0ABM8D2J4_9NOCA|nr:hypothetical protein IFM12276_45840 [Nocardia sputorum]